MHVGERGVMEDWDIEPERPAFRLSGPQIVLGAAGLAGVLAIVLIGGLTMRLNRHEFTFTSPGAGTNTSTSMSPEDEAAAQEDFHLIAPDGAVAEPSASCSDGLRRLVFPAAGPGLLVYGRDRAEPGAVWDLRS